MIIYLIKYSEITLFNRRASDVMAKITLHVLNEDQ